MTGRKAQAADRLAKLFVDLEQDADLDAAITRLTQTPVQLLLEPDVAESETLQLCSLLATTTALRAFPAGVKVILRDDGPLLPGLSPTGSIAAALASLGADIARRVDVRLPSVVIGGREPLRGLGRHAVRAVPRGWAGGAVPVNLTAPVSIPGVLGATLAGAIGVSECFLGVHGLEVRACRRVGGFSAWSPDLLWTDDNAAGPRLAHLPSRTWLVGLGHLGQAMAWLLGALPYGEPKDVQIALQDIDHVSVENIGTSLLASRDNVGTRKTRVVDIALRAAGFETQLVERRMDRNQQLQADEPRFAIAGLDSPAARRPLSTVGWSPLLDAGIGAGARDFTQIVIRRLTDDRPSQRVFDVDDSGMAERLLAENAQYRSRVAGGEDRCGVLQAAGEAVGTAFVGATAAVMAIAEAIRPLHGGPSLDVMSVDLRNPTEVHFAIREERSTDWPPHAPARAMREGKAHSPAE